MISFQVLHVQQLKYKLTFHLSVSVKDVGITQSQFNIGIQMLCLGLVLWEIPSNLVLYRIGPALVRKLMRRTFHYVSEAC